MCYICGTINKYIMSETLTVRLPAPIDKGKLSKQAKKRGFVNSAKKGNVNAYIVSLVKNDLNSLI